LINVSDFTLAEADRVAIQLLKPWLKILRLYIDKTEAGGLNFTRFSYLK